MGLVTTKNEKQSISIFCNYDKSVKSALSGCGYSIIIALNSRLKNSWTSRHKLKNHSSKRHHTDGLHINSLSYTQSNSNNFRTQYLRLVPSLCPLLMAPPRMNFFVPEKQGIVIYELLFARQDFCWLALVCLPDGGSCQNFAR